MTPGKYKLLILQGATLAQTLTWRDSSNELVNLVGYTARLQARRSIEDSTTLFELTTENGGIALGGAAGTIALNLSATATAALSEGTGVYDLELISSGVVTRLLEGTVLISRNATR